MILQSSRVLIRLRLIVAVIFLLSMSFCGSPISEYTPGDSRQNVSIAHLKTFYKGAPTKIEGDFAISATVISSDRYGNFQNSLIIEDSTGGIELKISSKNIFSKFVINSGVVVNCNGLTLGSYGGSLQLGTESRDYGYECGFIAEDDLAKYVKVEQLSAGAEPHRFTRPDFSMRYVNCFVTLDGVQFTDEELNKTWGEQDGYAERRVIWCESGETTISTSPQATFNSIPLPIRRGRIDGILRFFGGRYYVVVINDGYVLMDKSRCSEN